MTQIFAKPIYQAVCKHLENEFVPTLKEFTSTCVFIPMSPKKEDGRVVVATQYGNVTILAELDPINPDTFNVVKIQTVTW